MSNEGVGKIKPKRAHPTKKPYDRSTSFLGKIRDSVKDLLIPSWLVQSSESASETDSGPATHPSQFVPTNDGHNGPQNPPPSLRQATSEADQVPHFNEMPRQQPSFSPASSSGESRNLVGEPYMSDFGPAPNVNIAQLEQQNISWHAKKQESPISKLTSAFQQEPKRRRTDNPARLRMSDSYLEETADLDSSSAPTGHLMMSTSVLKKQQTSKQAPNTPQLWSPEGARLRKALVPPVKDKPTFNSFLFASQSKTNPEGFGDSSFYQGKTCYGGSAARRKKALNTSLPYQSSLPLRKQVAVKSKLNSSLNATTSSTAQRILETLDRMSTPLGDAKRIPQEESTNDSIISFTPSSYRRASSLSSARSVTRPLQLASQGPPTSQHRTLSQAVLARNRNRVTGVDRRRAEEQDSSELVLSQETSSIRELSRPSLPRESYPAQTPASGNTGKLKSKKFSQHLSSRKDDDDEVTFVPNLRTAFTLPISEINPISFSSQPSSLATSSSSSIPSRSGTAAPLQFTFSTPIEERRPSAGNQSLNNMDQGFKFSSPIKASQSKVNAAGAEEGSKTTPEPAVGASSVLPAANFSTSVPAWGSTAPKPKLASPDIGGTSSSFKSYSKWSGFNNDSSAASDSASPGGFSLAPAASLKSGSVMDILGGKSSSPGAPAPHKSTEDLTPSPGAKPSAPAAGTDDLMAKFRKPAGSWDCDVCMLSNKPEAVKCIACETPKPGAKPSAPAAGAFSPKAFSPPQGTDDLMAKFMQPTGSWECDACMLSNKPEASKCVACETPKPGAASTAGASDSSNNSLAAMFKKPPGNWECDTCMVQNTSTASRCIACDSPKPGLEAAGIVSKKPESSTPAVAFAPGGGFTINVPATNATATGPGGFKFGSSTSSSNPSTSLPAPTGFVFGQSGTSSSTAPASTTASSGGGFKFGAPSVPATTAPAAGSSAPSLASPASGFTFGSKDSSALPTTSVTSNAAAPFQFGSSAPHSTPSDSSKSDSVASVVEVTPVGKLNSNTNGVSSIVDTNKSSSSAGFVFGASSAAAPSSSSSTLTNSDPSPTPSATTLPPQPQINFNFSAPKPSPSSTTTPAAPQLPAAAPQTNFPGSGKPAASGLFQFGAAPAGSPSNSGVGLGMGPNLTSGKAMVNGGFGAPSSLGKTASAPAGDSGFGGFGKNTFSAPAGASTNSDSQVGQGSKRGVGLEDSGAPSAKKSFSFGGPGGNEASINGGFHFGGAAQTSTPAFGGSAAGASAPAPAGGFGFGSAPKTSAPQPSGPAAGGGFQFGTSPAAPANTASFNFAQAAAAAKPTFEAPAQAASFKPGGMTANFNFGGAGQPSSAPFQFGAKPADSGSSAPAGGMAFTAPQLPQVPQLTKPGFGSAPGAGVGSFSLGVGADTSQRKIRRATRRIQRK